MKNLLLTLLILTVSYGAFSQTHNLVIYNGMSYPVVVHDIVTIDYNCGTSVHTQASPGVIIPPNSIHTFAPLNPGNSCHEWLVGSISSVSSMPYSEIKSYHPANGIPDNSGSSGLSLMNGYWYPYGTAGDMVLKLYP
jgi:hypothetical protein